MKEVQNKNHTDEAKRLNEELDQNLKDLQPESKEAFQGFEVKEEKNEKKKKAKKKKTPKQIIKRVIIVLAVIILLPCAAIVGMWALGKGSLFGGKMKMSKNVDGVKVQNQGDLVIYNGAGMETFIDDLKNSSDDKEKFVDLSKNLTLLSSAKDGKVSKDKVNPHTWLSIKNAMVELEEIYEKVSEIDPDNKDFYKKNLDKNLDMFKKMDEKFANELKDVDENKRYFVVSHAAFNYLANDYNLKQVAVTGISPEDEPSAKQLKTIADFVKKHDISTIFFEGKATPKVAETLAKSTNTKTSTLYTMENLTKEEAQMGYLKLMEENLKSLKESFDE